MINQKTPTEITDKGEISDRNIAVYLNMASMSPPIELHATMIRDLLSRGNKVTVYVCDSSFRSPMDNPFNRASMQRFKMFRVKDAIRDLKVKFKIINLKKSKEEVPEKTSVALETGVMSSFASLLRAQNKDEIMGKWAESYNSMLSSAKKLYNYFIDEITNECYDFVFMFNGRFGCVRPVLEVARDLHIGFGLYEVKKSINEIVFVNELVHSIDGNTKKALAFYEKNKNAAEINAKRFFEKKIENKDTGDPIYTKKQKHGSLPEEIQDTIKKIVAIFPTTEDEYKFIGKEWDGYVPESQVDEIYKLASSLPRDEYVLVVKMHPNQISTAENTIEKYLYLARKYSHIVVEQPLSEKDTYALMNRADFVVTFASTIGVEACYASKPVILIGDTNWGRMNVSYNVHSGTDAGELIRRGLEPKPKLGAIIWGNYLLSYKDELPALKIAGRGDFFVDGRRIGQSIIMRIMQLPAKLEIDVRRPGFKFSLRFILKMLDTAINIIKGKWAPK
jgi:hypothetical protein